MKRVNNVGFTLIELLVVVLIIGILAAVALPQYTKAVERARTAEAVQYLGDFATAQSIYYMANGSFTTTLTALDLELNPPDSDVWTLDTTTAGTATLTRGGSGIFSGGKLTITVGTDGKITKTCTDVAKGGFCNIVKSAGYEPPATSTNTNTNTPT